MKKAVTDHLPFPLLQAFFQHIFTFIEQKFMTSVPAVTLKIPLGVTGNASGF